MSTGNVILGKFDNDWYIKLIRDPNLSPDAKIAFQNLKINSNEFEETVKTLMYKCNITETRVTKALKELEINNLLTRTQEHKNGRWQWFYKLQYPTNKGIENNGIENNNVVTRALLQGRCNRGYNNKRSNKNKNINDDHFSNFDSTKKDSQINLDDYFFNLYESNLATRKETKSWLNKHGAEKLNKILSEYDGFLKANISAGYTKIQSWVYFKKYVLDADGVIPERIKQEQNKQTNQDKKSEYKDIFKTLNIKHEQSLLDYMIILTSKLITCSEKESNIQKIKDMNLSLTTTRNLIDDISVLLIAPENKIHVKKSNLLKHIENPEHCILELKEKLGV